MNWIESFKKAVVYRLLKFLKNPGIIFFKISRYPRIPLEPVYEYYISTSYILNVFSNW